MSDFNCRQEDEMLWRPTPDIVDMLDLFLQELDILFSTEQGSVLGQRKFGVSFERLLWSTSLNASAISNQITEQITQFSEMSKEFTWQVDVELIKGSLRDIGVITVDIKSKQGEQLASPSYVFK